MVDREQGGLGQEGTARRGRQHVVYEPPDVAAPSGTARRAVPGCARAAAARLLSSAEARSLTAPRLRRRATPGAAPGARLRARWPQVSAPLLPPTPPPASGRQLRLSPAPTTLKLTMKRPLTKIESGVRVYSPRTKKRNVFVACCDGVVARQGERHIQNVRVPRRSACAARQTRISAMSRHGGWQQLGDDAASVAPSRGVSDISGVELGSVLSEQHQVRTVRRWCA